MSTNPGMIVAPGRSTTRSACGRSPLPTRCTCRSSTSTHSPVCGYDGVCTARRGRGSSRGAIIAVRTVARAVRRRPSTAAIPRSSTRTVFCSCISRPSDAHAARRPSSAAALARRSEAKIATSSTQRTKLASVTGAPHPRAPARRWRAARTRPARPAARRRRRPGTRGATRDLVDRPAGRRRHGADRRPARGDRCVARADVGHRDEMPPLPSAGRHRAIAVERASTFQQQSAARVPAHERFACTRSERAPHGRRDARRRSARTPPRPPDRDDQSRVRRPASGPPRADRPAGPGPVGVLRRFIALLSFDPRRSVARR